MNRIFWIIIFLSLFIFSCKKQVNEIEHNNQREICKVELSYMRAKEWYDPSYVLDEMPEDFLFNNKNDLIYYTIYDKDSLNKFGRLLCNSTFVREDSIPFFETIFCISVHYQDGGIDTIGIPMNNKMGFMLNNRIYDSPDLIDYTIGAIASCDVEWREIIERSKWKGNYKFHRSPSFVKKYSSEYYNYGSYISTEAEGLAMCMAHENMDSIQLLIRSNPSLMYAREPLENMPIIFHCIRFQQDSILKLFLENGFDPNYSLLVDSVRSVMHGLPPLMVACQNAYYNPCGFLLIDYGADINYQSSFYPRYNTPLQVAVRNRNFEMTKYLLDRGANIEQHGYDDYLNKYGKIGKEEERPIDISIKWHFFKLTYLLIIKGAKTDTQYIRRQGGLGAILSSIKQTETSPENWKYILLIKDYLKTQIDH